jgi:hypothetical protein
MEGGGNQQISSNINNSNNNIRFKCGAQDCGYQSQVLYDLQVSLKDFKWIARPDRIFKMHFF